MDTAQSGKDARDLVVLPLLNISFSLSHLRRYSYIRFFCNARTRRKRRFGNVISTRHYKGANESRFSLEVFYLMVAKFMTRKLFLNRYGFANWAGC